MPRYSYNAVSPEYSSCKYLARTAKLYDRWVSSSTLLVLLVSKSRNIHYGAKAQQVSSSTLWTTPSALLDLQQLGFKNQKQRYTRRNRYQFGVCFLDPECQREEDRQTRKLGPRTCIRGVLAPERFERFRSQHRSMVYLISSRFYWLFLDMSDGVSLLHSDFSGLRFVTPPSSGPGPHSNSRAMRWGKVKHLANRRFECLERSRRFRRR